MAYTVTYTGKLSNGVLSIPDANQRIDPKTGIMSFTISALTAGITSAVALGYVTVTGFQDGAGAVAGYLPVVYTQAITPAAVGANTAGEQTFTVTGLLTTDIVLRVVKPTSQAGLSCIGGRVSAANTLALQFVNDTAGSITPTAAESYTVAVLRVAV